MEKFAGKVAIVTGGAAGIGGASARLLAEHGASVLIADINTAEAQANAETIRGAGGTAEVTSTNVGRHEDIAAMVQTAIDRWGRPRHPREQRLQPHPRIGRGCYCSE